MYSRSYIHTTSYHTTVQESFAKPTLIGHGKEIYIKWYRSPPPPAQGPKHQLPPSPTLHSSSWYRYVNPSSQSSPRTPGPKEEPIKQIKPVPIAPIMRAISKSHAKPNPHILHALGLTPAPLDRETI
jgi:hypothetical protein